MLKNNGYATGLIGKWHLGYKPEFSPNAHGFDYFFGFKSGFIDYYQHTGGDGQPDLFENDDAGRSVDGYMTDLITQRSVQFIEQHAQQPFFLEVAYNAAHWPFQRAGSSVEGARQLRHVPGRTTMRHRHTRGLRRDAGARRSGRRDRSCETLDRLRLARNTLVIFTNDNGGEWLSRNAPLFHRKDTLWEGGIRVPAIFRWPGRLPAGQRSRAQVGITMDLTASILAATGTPVPPDAQPRGHQPASDPRGTARRRSSARCSGGSRRPTRQQRAVRQGDWKLLVDGGDLLLFNLTADIGERNDLASQRTDIARQLFPLIAPWEADVDAESGVGARGGAGGRGTGGVRGAGDAGAGRGRAGRGNER